MEFILSLYGNRWVRYALTIVLVLALMYRLEPAHLLASVKSSSLPNVALALLLTVPFLFFKMTRWHLMLRSGGIVTSFSDSAVSLIAGMGLGLVTPARLGEVVRAAYLRDPRKLKIGGLVMIDKGMDVVILTGLSIVGGWHLVGPSAGALLLFAFAFGMATLYLPNAASRVLHAISARLPLRSNFERVWSSLDTLTSRNTTYFLLLTLLSFAVVMLQFAIILQSWYPWSLDVVLLTFPLVVLTNVLPITIGGLGVREATAVVLLGHFGISPAHAAVAAFLMFALNTAAPGLVGALIRPPRSVPRASAPVTSSGHC